MKMSRLAAFFFAALLTAAPLAGPAFASGGSTLGGTIKLTQDPTVSSGGSSTDGAVFFGTGLGTRYIDYNAATGGTGGYSLGNTFGNADTLYVGPIALNNALLSQVKLKAPGSGIWTLTFPTSGGVNGQVLTTNGSGTTSWTNAGAGTVTSVATGTGLTGGTITSSGTVSCNTLSSVTTGCGRVDGSTLTASGGVMSVANPIGPHVSSGGFDYFALPGGWYWEFGGVSANASGVATITWPHALATAVSSFTATVNGQACYVYTTTASTTTGSATALHDDGTPCVSAVILWTMVGT